MLFSANLWHFRLILGIIFGSWLMAKRGWPPGPERAPQAFSRARARRLGSPWRPLGVPWQVLIRFVNVEFFPFRAASLFYSVLDWISMSVVFCFWCMLAYVVSDGHATPSWRVASSALGSPKWSLENRGPKACTHRCQGVSMIIGLSDQHPMKYRRLRSRCSTKCSVLDRAG